MYNDSLGVKFSLYAQRHDWRNISHFSPKYVDSYDRHRTTRYLYSSQLVGGYYVSKYVSSAHPPVQLHSNVPIPSVLYVLCASQQNRFRLALTIFTIRYASTKRKSNCTKVYTNLHGPRVA